MSCAKSNLSQNEVHSDPDFLLPHFDQKNSNSHVLE